MAKAKKQEESGVEAGFKGLSNDNLEWMKSFEDLGWRFTYEDTGWAAHRDDLEDPDAFHSFGSFIAMMNAVERAQNEEDGVQPVKEDVKGNRFLPGAEPLSVPYLDNLTQRRIALVREFKTASAAVSEINQDILNAFNDEKLRKHFVLDNETGKHQYRAAGGGGLRINHKTVDKVESFDEEVED